MLAYLLVVVISYFMGTISCAYLISKFVFSSDIRKYGSKNPGTTNMLRTFGKRAGAVTLIGDYIKDHTSQGHKGRYGQHSPITSGYTLATPKSHKYRPIVATNYG